MSRRIRALDMFMFSYMYVCINKTEKPTLTWAAAFNRKIVMATVVVHEPNALTKLFIFGGGFLMAYYE